MSTLRTLRSATLAFSVITALGITVMSTSASAAPAAPVPAPVVTGADLSVPMQTSSGVQDFRCADIAGAWNPATTECPPGVQSMFDQIATADVAALDAYVYSGTAGLGVFGGVDYTVPETALIGVMACSIGSTDPVAGRSLWQSVMETQYPEAVAADFDAAWSSSFTMLCPWLGTSATAATVPATPTTAVAVTTVPAAVAATVPPATVAPATVAAPVTAAPVTPVNVVTVAEPVGYPTNAPVSINTTDQGLTDFGCGDVMYYVGAAPCLADVQQVWDQIVYAEPFAVNEFVNNAAIELGVFESLDYTVGEVASVGVLACVSAQRGLDSVGYGAALVAAFPEATQADADVLWTSALTELCAWQLS
jgi:hypothetical protein